MARKRMEEPTIKSWEETDEVMKKTVGKPAGSGKN